MTAKQYEKLASKLGTRAQVSAALGVDIGTVFRRISGALPITKEAALALASLGKPSRAKKRTNAEMSSEEAERRLQWEPRSGRSGRRFQSQHTNMTKRESTMFVRLLQKLTAEQLATSSRSRCKE